MSFLEQLFKIISTGAKQQKKYDRLQQSLIRSVSISLAGSVRIIMDCIRIVNDTSDFGTKLSRNNLLCDHLKILDSYNGAYKLVYFKTDFEKLLKESMSIAVILNAANDEQKKVIANLKITRKRNICPYCANLFKDEITRSRLCPNCKGHINRFKPSPQRILLLTDEDLTLIQNTIRDSMSIKLNYDIFQCCEFASACKNEINKMLEKYKR
jgi:hypothetical protein